MKYVLAIIAAIALPLNVCALTIDLVPIGNPNNPSDIQGGVFGQVATSYRIGKTEVTNAQYVEFLNAKGATDPYGLYNPSMNTFSTGGITRSGMSGSYTYSVKPDVPNVEPGMTTYTYGNKPVVYVSWYDAIRFANWMHNGQGIGDTETGAYTIQGGTATPSNPDLTRNAGATWFLPTENQWYKAAYYDSSGSGSYHVYPTGTNTPPNNNLPTSDSGNSANFLGTSTTTGNTSYPLTNAGAYLLSDSPYGTFDQGGNVAEWNETFTAAGRRVRRGGSWGAAASDMSSATRESVLSITENPNTGFRLAALQVSNVPGDYNGNGVVDGADYVVWRKHNGTTFVLQNEVASTSTGVVDQNDYIAWRARFGNTSGAGSGSDLQNSFVPEPSAVLLAAVVGALFSAQARRNRSTF